MGPPDAGESLYMLTLFFLFIGVNKVACDEARYAIKTAVSISV